MSVPHYKNDMSQNFSFFKEDFRKLAFGIQNAVILGKHNAVILRLKAGTGGHI
jgi:hypothetical protein